MEIRNNIGKFFVRHPAFAQVEREICNIVELGRAEGEGECVLVTSPSGTGKTTLYRLLLKNYGTKALRRNITNEKSPTTVSAPYLPVLFYEIPPQPRLSVLVQGLLEVLGDPKWNKGRLHDCCYRLDGLLSDCGTTTIVFDEVQRLVDITGVITSISIIEELKRLHGRHGLNLIFLGLGRIKYILEDDAQFRDRWSLEFRLRAFECFHYEAKNDKVHKVVDEDQWLAWKGVLFALQQQTGLVTSVPLSSDDLADRLYYATAGVLRRLKNLLRRSLVLLAEQGGREVTSDLLALAFEAKDRGAANPFTAGRTDDLSLPHVDDDYKLKPPARKLREKKVADARSKNAGADIIRALRG